MILTPIPGTPDYGPALSGATTPIEITAGTYPITTNTIISQPMQFHINAKFVISANVTLTVNGYVAADWYQQIFSSNATPPSDTVPSNVFGTFGSCPLSPGWWGAVPDGFSGSGGSSPVPPSGTNNLRAFQYCLGARHRTIRVAAKVFVPAGRWLIQGASLPAVANPEWTPTNGKPEHLAESGMLQLYPGDCMVGEGWDSCGIIVGNSGNGNVIAVGGVNTSGPPSEVGGFALGAVYGGVFTRDGLMVYANGAQIRDVWINGFGTGMRLDSTDQFAHNFVIEYCSAEGLRVTRGATTVSDGLTHLNGNGIVISHQDDQGITVMDNVRVVGRDSSQSGGYGIAIDGFSTKVQLVNCAVEGQYVTRAYWLNGTPWAQLSNCSARVYGNGDGLRIENSNNVTVTNFVGEEFPEAGEPTSSSQGISILNSSDVSITNSTVRGFNIGAFNDTVGGNINYNNLNATRNKDCGLYTARCSLLNVVGGNFNNNSGSSGTPCGIVGNITETADIHLYTAITAMNSSGGGQKFGVRYRITHVGGRVRVSGASASLLNTDGQINAGGGSYTSAPQFVVGAEVVM